MNDVYSILALDYGDKRVGVAITNVIAKLPQPLITLDNNQQLIENLKQIVSDQKVKTVVVGLPTNLNGQDSDQTTKIRKFIDQLKADLTIEVVTEDETLSSLRAETELSKRGKIFAKADIDKLAACLILEDYIEHNL